MTDYTELKRLCEDLISANESYLDDDLNSEKRGAFHDADDALQDALPPEVVLAMIAENERLERLALDSLNAEHATNTDLESICAERDQLRAEVAGLKTGYEAYQRVNAELKAEVEALRKECARLTEDNLALLENPGDAL